jgi:hypothetical protein
MRECQPERDRFASRKAAVEAGWPYSMFASPYMTLCLGRSGRAETKERRERDMLRYNHDASLQAVCGEAPSVLTAPARAATASYCATGVANLTPGSCAVMANTSNYGTVVFEGHYLEQVMKCVDKDRGKNRRPLPPFLQCQQPPTQGNESSVARGCRTSLDTSPRTERHHCSECDAACPFTAVTRVRIPLGTRSINVLMGRKANYRRRSRCRRSR